MKSKKLSARQLAVAVMVGGLSAGAAIAGRGGWWWTLAGAAAGTAMGWLLLRRVGYGRLHPALRALYGGWAVVLMARTLDETARRLQPAAGERGAAWMVLLLALPLVWMSWGKGAAFFRMAEVLWLGAAAAVAAILLLGLPRVDWEWAAEPAGSWGESLLAGTLPMAAGLYALPHLYKVKEGPGDLRRGLAWLAALGAVSGALGLLTAGLLHPAVAAKLDGPFFAAAGLLGDSARLEGLAAAVWLLPDLVWMGLLARSWGEGRGPALAVLAAAGLALGGIAAGFPAAACAAGCLALAVLTAALPPEGRK